VINIALVARLIACNIEKRIAGWSASGPLATTSKKVFSGNVLFATKCSIKV